MISPYDNYSGCSYDEDGVWYEDIDYGDDGIEGSGESIGVSDDYDDEE